MTHRIELTFVGDAPPDEMARAKILAAPEVTAAIQALSGALDAAGFTHEVRARTVRPPARRATKPFGLPAAAAE